MEILNNLEKIGKKELKIDSECGENLDILKNYVKEIYRKSAEGDVSKEKQLEKFNQHNEDILRYIEDLAKEERISPIDSGVLKLAAVLHDVAKFDVPLVKHGFEGAKMAEEKLKELNFNADTVKKIKNAIERHMGPIPGFMADEAKRWEEKTGEKIEFPRPKTIVDKLLYDADMLSLIDKKGIEKILAIRKNVEVFRKEDEEFAVKEGISAEEAAWRSALKSGKEASVSLFTDSAKNKAKALLKNAEALMKESLGI